MSSVVAIMLFPLQQVLKLVISEWLRIASPDTAKLPGRRHTRADLLSGFAYLYLVFFVDALLVMLFLTLDLPLVPHWVSGLFFD
jgi:hypothetical protein